MSVEKLDRRSTDQELGYLHRAVEDLSRAVKNHMDSEERDRQDIKDRFKEIKEEIKERDDKVHKRIDSLEKKNEEILKKYFIIGFAVLGIISETSDTFNLMQFLSSLF